jgi:hypothetical protein
MYPPEQYPVGPPPGTSNKTAIIAVVVIAFLLIVITGILSLALGYWLGYRAASESTQVAKTESPAPTPQPMPTATASPTPTPTPTPTPDVAGKYTNSMGSVDITNVTDKSFNFSIGVGNESGTGQIDGQATRNSPSVAVYSKIPDPNLYNDPDSEYYHKKCHLTFRFSGTKLAVSEDDFACSYWHGAQVDFNGTFNLKKK